MASGSLTFDRVTSFLNFDLESNLNETFVLAIKDELSDLSFLYSDFLTYFIKKDYPVLIINLTQSFHHYNQILLKSGINMKTLKSQGKVFTIDVLAEAENAIDNISLEKRNLPSLCSFISDPSDINCLKTLFKQIEKEVKSILNSKPKHYLLLFDEINVLLNLGVPFKAVNHLIQSCYSLCISGLESSGMLLIGALLDQNDIENAKHVNYLTHICDLQLRIEGLKTGFSKDTQGKSAPKMYEYHVTYGQFKKIIKSKSNMCKNIYEPIKKAFSLFPISSIHLQCWHEKYNDWVDCEESEEIKENSKLNVIQNVHNIQQIDSSVPLEQPSTMDNTSRCSTPSANSLSSLVLEEFSLFDEQSSNQSPQQPPQKMTIEDFPHFYELPKFPGWIQTMLDAGSKLCKNAKCGRVIIDTLFNDLLRYGSYPTSRMFQETAWTLVEAYPILKDKEFPNSHPESVRPHESWVLRLRDKFKKYRKRHPELCNANEINIMKSRYGIKRRKRVSVNLKDSSVCLEESLTSVKRKKVEKWEYTENEFIIKHHIEVLQEECQKQNPNQELIQEKMARTFKERTVYVAKHSVAETLAYFPPLRQINVLLAEAKRLEISEADLREFLITKNSSLSELAKIRSRRDLGLSQLLLAQAKCFFTKDNEHAFSILTLPCLLQEKYPLLYAEENIEISVLQPAIIYRNSRNVLNNSSFELFLDKQFVTKTDNLVTAITLWFTFFWLFDVEYCRNHIKFLSFLDTFVFKKCTVKSIPRSVKSLYNVI